MRISDRRPLVPGKLRFLSERLRLEVKVIFEKIFKDLEYGKSSK